MSTFENDFFLYILGLQPTDRELVAIKSIQLAPQWSLVLVYGLILSLYVHGFIRSRITPVSVLTGILILFGLLMLEVVLAVFLQLFLPVVFPALVLLLLSSVYWVSELYRSFVGSVRQQESITIDDVRTRIDKGDQRTAFTKIKLCP